MSEQCVDLVVIVSQAAVTQSTVDRYAAYWRGVIAGLPQQPETEEDFLAARDFAKAAPDEERRIKEALNSILQGSPEIAEIVRTLQEMEVSLRSARLRCSKAVDAETEYRKTQILDDGTRLVRMRDAELFGGPLAAVSLPDPTERLYNAGKGKRTLETYGEAVRTEAETIITERTALAALCRTNLDLINAADLPAVSAVAESLMQRPTTEVQGVIAQRRAEAEAAALKKQAVVQRNPERLAANKADIELVSNLYHLDNWRRKHKARVETELPHPDDQAELWQFFGSHYARVESRNKPPHPADAYQAAPQVPPVQHQETARQTAAVQQPLPSPAAPEREQEPESKAAAAPIQPAPPAAPSTTERPEGMPETGSAFRLELYCGAMSKPEMQALLDKIFDLAEEHGAQVVSAKTI